MVRLLFGFLFVFILSAMPVWAQSVITFPVGQIWQFGDARSLGLAGAGSVSQKGAAALLQNPAALGKTVPGFSIQVSTGLRKLDERRSFPIYNRIDDITQLGTYAININYFPNIQGGISYGVSLDQLPFLKSISAGIFNDLDQDYRYDEEVRENIFGDSLMAFNRIEYDGKLTRYSVGAGLEFLKTVHLGVQLGFLNGDLTGVKEIRFVKKGFTDLRQKENRELANTPAVLSFGAMVDLDPHLTVGSHIRLPYTVEYNLRAFGGDTLSGSATESVEYPFVWNVGLEYRARQALQARLNIDFQYEWWSDTQIRYREVSGAVSTRSFNFEDAISIRAGIEHIFFNQIPFLVGVQYRTSYYDRSTTQTLISAGTGFMDHNWKVELAGGISKLSYKYSDLFDDTLYGGNRSTSPLDDVDENYFFGMATLRLFLRK